MANLTKLSKFLSLMLRHRPANFGLTLDEQGFVDVADVWARVIKRYGNDYSYDDFLAVVAGTGDAKQRFEIVGERIRARYGHSAVQTITYNPVEPPAMLYHGTTPEALESIRVEGLTGQQRQYVHLSLDADWAQRVGRRRVKAPVILTIQAGVMHAAGFEFYHPEPNHYLTKSVPVEYIEFPQ